MILMTLCNMKKELVIIIILTIFIVLISLYFGIFSSSRYVSNLIDNDKWNEIIKTHEKSEDLIKNLKFDNELLLYDSSGMYFYSLINYEPNIYYKSVGKHAKVAFKKTITDELIENNEALEMLIYTKDKYDVKSIIVTKLPILNLTYSSDDLDEYVDMKFSMFDNEISAKIEEHGLIKYRGASTLIFPKKSFRITLDNSYNILGLRDDEDLILYAAYNDQEKIRNAFSSELWYSINGVGNTYKYIELFINNEYEGLYAISYPIDEKALKIDKFNDISFRKYGWEAESKSLKDGYMKEYELVTEVDDTIAQTKLLNFYDVYFNSNDLDKLYGLIDVDNAIDIFLFYNLIQGEDNANDYDFKNTFMTFINDKVLYTPWDLDLTFGNGFNKNQINLTNMYYYKPSDNFIMKLNPIYKIKKLDVNINKSIINRYTYLRKTVWSEDSIDKIITEYEKDIYNSGAFLRDMNRWENGNFNNPKLKLSKFKDYVFERLIYMDKYVAEYVSCCIK